MIKFIIIICISVFIGVTAGKFAAQKIAIRNYDRIEHYEKTIENGDF